MQRICSKRFLSKGKRPFVLLEVMISIALFTIVSTWTYRSLSHHFHEQLQDLRRIEAQRLAELTYYDFLENWFDSGSFDEPNTNFDSLQSLCIGEQSLIRKVTLLTTGIRDYREHQFKKITLKVHYPDLKITMKFPLVISRTKKTNV